MRGSINFRDFFDFGEIGKRTVQNSVSNLTSFRGFLGYFWKEKLILEYSHRRPNSCRNPLSSVYIPFFAIQSCHSNRNILGSEEMALVQLFIPSEIARSTVSSLGEA